MNAAPSSTYFSAPPDWGWLIVSYFFLGGLAGGCYFFAALIDLFGRPEDRPLAHLGYYIALPCLILSGMLLTFDLGRPLRFWHMLIESNTYRPMLKPWSPMSAGSWALLAFGAFTFLAFLAALAEEDRLAWAPRVRPPAPPRIDLCARPAEPDHATAPPSALPAPSTIDAVRSAILADFQSVNGPIGQ